MGPESDNEKAFFSSPYGGGGGPTPEPPLNLGFVEAGRRGEPRQGLAARVRGRLGVRTTQRRIVWGAIFMVLCWFVWNRNTGDWTSSVEVATPSPAESYFATGSALPDGDETTADEEDDDDTDAPAATDQTPVELPPEPEPEPVPYGPPDLPYDASLSDLRTVDRTIPKPKDYSPFYGGSSKREIDIASDPLPLEATLEERLAVWRNAPGGRGEIPGEVELGGFMQWNLEECGSIAHSYNTHMIQVGTIVWASFNRSTLHRERERLITYMESLIGTPALENRGTGRGIVMQAGNVDTLRRAVWSIRYMRAHGSTLPVQIWCFPDELPAPDDEIYTTLAALNATLTAAKGQSKDVGKNKSYHLKAIAMIENPFAEVLYLDSDSIPARDPEYMFDAPSYKRLGIFATPDYWKTTAGNPIWAIMGVKCRGEWEMETGQMFIDKQHHLDVLWLVRYMLEHHADEGDWPGYFKYSDGDKDLFRWAMLMLRKRWGVPGRWVAGGALPYDTQTGFCSHTMLQHDAWGEPLFVHYNLLKQIPSGVGRNFCWGRHKGLPLFNEFPARPESARLGEPVLRPSDADKRGLGDIDCDMLADADEFGVARAPAKEMIMRRAARERGVKVKYHGGSVSALCIDFDYVDPRPEPRRKSEQAQRDADQAAQVKKMEQWEVDAAAARAEDKPEPPRPSLQSDTVLPNWRSPFEVTYWNEVENLRTFENELFDLGFVPSAHGF